MPVEVTGPQVPRPGYGQEGLPLGKDGTVKEKNVCNGFRCTEYINSCESIRTCKRDTDRRREEETPPLHPQQSNTDPTPWIRMEIAKALAPYRET